MIKSLASRVRSCRTKVCTAALLALAAAAPALSTGEQLESTIAKHFAGQTCLMIAEVDLILLGDAVRWEEARGGALFPHLYAELPIQAVIGLQKRD